MEQRSFVVGIQYKHGVAPEESLVAALMASHNFLVDPFRPNHFRGHSFLTAGELVKLLQGALVEHKIQAFVAVELLRPPQPFADQRLPS